MYMYLYGDMMLKCWSDDCDDHDNDDHDSDDDNDDHGNMNHKLESMYA